MTILRRFFQWLQPRMPYINIGLAVFALLANQYLVQGFCQPVAWATVVLVLSIGAFLGWPWLVQAPAAVCYAALFLQGLGFTVCVYCAWFMGLQSILYLTGLFFFWLLVPALVWVPSFFGMQILRRVSRVGLSGQWPVFLLGVFALAPALWWANEQFMALDAAVSTLPLAQRTSIPALARVLPRTYMVERVAGAGFLYHTDPEFFLDGSRPPLHDPLFVICLKLHKTSALYGGEDYKHRAGVDLYPIAYPVMLYHALFPNRPIKAKCGCNSW
jgi:hypothetical protein